MFETIYDKKFLYCKMSRSNLIDIFILIFDYCIQNNFTKSINSNRLLKIFAIVFVRELYSYETNVNDLNWLSFKITTSWLEFWNEIVLNSTKTLHFKLIFLLQSIMQNFLRQCLMTMSTKFVVKNSLLLLFVVYKNNHYANLIVASNAIHVCYIRKFCWSFFWFWIVYCIHDQFMQNHHFFYWTIWIFCMTSDMILFFTFAILIIVKTSSTQRFWLNFC